LWQYVLRRLLPVTFLVVSRPERRRRSPMSEYAQETAEVFAPARACYEETERWLARTEASALTYAELETSSGRGDGSC
jgi:hypothetical protein